jgi:ribosome recycling factor
MIIEEVRFTMDERIKVYDEKMQKTIEFLEEDYASIRAGRANPHLLDKIKVDYYGTPSGLNAVANISVPEARIIQIQPWEAKMVKEISKAILASDLGITPTDDGRVIRLVFPELTEDRRKELAKDIKKKGENAKVAIRNVRRDANEAIKKLGKSSEISEDVQKQIEEEINKMTEKYCDKCDKLSDDKTKEIMTV